MSEDPPAKEYLSIRFQELEQVTQFERIFNLSKEFNKKAKEGSDQLVWLNVVEDEAEVEEFTEDNKMAATD